MRGVIIRDGTEPGGPGGLEFDLRDILETLGPRAAKSDWRCAGLQYCSTDEQDVPSLDRAALGQCVRGTELIADTARILQVIDGEFQAFEGEGSPWVVVRAIDSSWWEVLSDDPSVFTAIATRFRVVQDLPSDAV